MLKENRILYRHGETQSMIIIRPQNKAASISKTQIHQN